MTITNLPDKKYMIVHGFMQAFWLQVGDHKDWYNAYMQVLMTIEIQYELQTGQTIIKKKNVKTLNNNLYFVENMCLKLTLP